MQNKFIKLFAEPKKDRPVLDLTLTVGELAADTVMKGDVLEAVPFVGLAFKALKAKDTVSDALYARKLVGFVNGIGDLAPKEREKAAAQLLKQDAQVAGETILLVLDRITDLDKPELLGLLFKHFALGRMTSEQLRRLAVAVDSAFGDDLRDFLWKPPESTEEDVQDCLRRLAPSGLTFLNFEPGTIRMPKYHFTELGTFLFGLVLGEHLNDPVPSGRRPAKL